MNLGALTAADGTIKDLRIGTAAVYGGKLGYFFEPRVLDGNFGLELEASHFKSDVDAQTARFSGAILGAPFNGDLRVVRSDIEVTTVALNGLYRYPLGMSEDFPRGRFQPYVGAGLGAFIAKLSTTTTPLDVNKDIHDTDTRLGGQFLGGIRVLVTRNIALFAEYKFVTTQTFEFTFNVPGTVFGGVPVTETARERLSTIEQATELGAGFRIALKDLEIRGAGNILGPEQSGQVAAVGLDLRAQLLGGCRARQRFQLHARVARRHEVGEQLLGNRIPEAVNANVHWIVMCDEGYASSLAAATLQAIGLRRATDLAGGFRAWRAATLPVAPTGAVTPPRLALPRA